MERFTRRLEGGAYSVEEESMRHEQSGFSGEAINRLGAFEDAYLGLLASQEEITAEMDRLRAEGKTSSVKFRQLFAKKLMNNEILSRFEKYGIK